MRLRLLLRPTKTRTKYRNRFYTNRLRHSTFLTDAKSGAPALQNPVQHTRAASRSDSQETTQAPDRSRAYANLCDVMPAGAQPSSGEDRIRTTHINAGKTNILSQGAAKSGAVELDNSPLDPDPQVIIEAWPDLSKDTKAAIMAITRSFE